MSAEKLIEELREQVAHVELGLSTPLDTTHAVRELASCALRAADALTATQADNEWLRKALEEAGQAFEAIRVLLVNDLDEPGRTVFWRAVKERDAILAARSALPEQEEGK